MDIIKVHLTIEQKLQQVGVFAYDDFHPDEIDLQINESQNSIIKSAFRSIRPENKVEDTQLVLDRFRVLKVGHKTITGGVIDDDFVKFQLPEDYLHLLDDYSLVEDVANCKKLEACDPIKYNFKYKVIKGRVLYNGEFYKEGEIFIGIENVENFSVASGEKGIVREVKTKRSPNRLTESNLISTVLDNTLYTTSSRSPISEIVQQELLVHFSNFVVEGVKISYIRKPQLVNFHFKRYSSTDALSTNTKYQVVKETVNYNGTTYGLGETFTTTSISAFTGTGEVKLENDGDLLFPDFVCDEIIANAVQQLAIISEQNQQKIANLVQTNDVPS